MMQIIVSCSPTWGPVLSVGVKNRVRTREASLEKLHWFEFDHVNCLLYALCESSLQSMICLYFIPNSQSTHEKQPKKQKQETQLTQEGHGETHRHQTSSAAEESWCHGNTRHRTVYKWKQAFECNTKSGFEIRFTSVISLCILRTRRDEILFPPAPSSAKKKYERMIKHWNATHYLVSKRVSIVWCEPTLLL